MHNRMRNIVHCHIVLIIRNDYITPASIPSLVSMNIAFAPKGQTVSCDCDWARLALLVAFQIGSIGLLTL